MYCSSKKEIFIQFEDKNSEYTQKSKGFISNQKTLLHIYSFYSSEFTHRRVCSKRLEIKASYTVHYPVTRKRQLHKRL